MSSGEEIYHGHAPETGGPGLVTVETTAGEALGPLAHQVRHSPTGFAWGYGGSGPADLARSLLAAALGDNARCPDCGGAGRVVVDPDGILEVLAYDPEVHENAVDPALVETCREGETPVLAPQKPGTQALGARGETVDTGPGNCHPQG